MNPNNLEDVARRAAAEWTPEDAYRFGGMMSRRINHLEVVGKEERAVEVYRNFIARLRLLRQVNTRCTYRAFFNGYWDNEALS